MKLSVFTINIWGLIHVKHRAARVKALADALNKSEYDIVCIQELWCDGDYKHLELSCKNVFKYIHYFHSGMLGSGTCIMSRYQIIDIHYHPFILNGYLHMLTHGDWFGGKGIGMCRINVNGYIVDVYTTHLHACYNPSNDKYLKHRVVQAFETGNFIRLMSADSDLVVLAGDLNSEPEDICYKLICLSSKLKDCYSMCITNSIKYTFNHPNNSNYTQNEMKSRLDYILYKFNKKNLVIVKEHRHSLPFRVPGKNYSYSDHEPIEAVFEISADKFNFENTDKIIDNDLQYKTELHKVIKDSLEICNTKTRNPLHYNHYSVTIRHFILLLLLLVMLYVQSCEIVHYGFFITIVFVMYCYCYVTESIEQNCVRGFCQKLETLFLNHQMP